MLQTSVLDRTRLFSNALLIILLAGNIFFSIQYISNLKQFTPVQEGTSEFMRIKSATFLKFFVDKVLRSEGTISFDDRVKLENDVRTIGSPQLTRQWEKFVASKNTKEAQGNAVDLMAMLSDMVR